MKRQLSQAQFPRVKNTLLSDNERNEVKDGEKIEGKNENKEKNREIEGGWKLSDDGIWRNKEGREMTKRERFEL